jgi:DNA repair exonuclease SbcCD ATPase subunit
MIKLKKMSWSNVFSYGENNYINFDSSPLTQIVGFNGHGKSSIALILEEVLYNKNSKNIKKADILNRNSKAKTYSIELEFEKDNSVYNIKTVRGATQTVVLLKDNTDISSHTATATFKAIEGLIGYDHKTFCQIVYQSSAASLEFLTATDTNRKKFLIDLLNLNKYVEIGEYFKEELKTLDKNLAVINTKINTTDSLIKKYSKEPQEQKALVEVLNYPKDLEEKNAVLLDRLRNLEKLNKRVIQNNKYKELLDSIIVELPGEKPKLLVNTLITEKAEHDKAVKDSSAFILKMNRLGSSCPTCLQKIDQTKINELVQEHNEICEAGLSKSKMLEEVISSFYKDVSEWERKERSKKQYEEYYNLYDPTMEKTTTDQKELEKEIAVNSIKIKDIEASIAAATKTNNEVLAHNARVVLIKEQLVDHNKELLELFESKKLLEDKISKIGVLTKTFSSTGLIAYKIECLVKDLEDLINRYLSTLSDGRFQLSFKINDSDKLNVVVTDNGKDIEMTALSSGERARVNAAALLGIRKLMQGISNTRINVLILDETIENLDLEGKEKLIEVLLQEPYLNTFIISHGFSHPLLEKIHVVKTKNISRIENG